MDKQATRYSSVQIVAAHGKGEQTNKKKARAN